MSNTDRPSYQYVNKKIEEAKLDGSNIDLSGYAKKTDAETWTFTLEDGSTVTKKVVLA